MLQLLKLTLLFQAGGYLLQFGAFVIFARVLGPEGQGVLAIFRSTGQILAPTLWFGVPTGIVYFIGKEKRFFRPLVLNCLKWFGIAFIGLLTALTVLPVQNIPKLNIIDPYMPLLLLFVFLLCFFGLFQAIVLSLKKYVLYNLFTLGLGISVVSGAILAAVATVETELTFAIECYIAAYAVLFVYGLIVVAQYGRGLWRSHAPRLAFLDQFKVGFRGYISSVASLLLFRADMFLVVYFLSFRDVGIYSIAVFCAEAIIRVPTWSASILTPMVASSEAGHVRRTMYLFYFSILFATVFGLIALTALTLFPTFISAALGKDFAGVETCLLFLLPRVVMQSGTGVFGANLAGKGYPWYHPTGCVLSLVLVLALDLVLIPIFGINGAAAANSLGFVAAAVVFSIGFTRLNHITDDLRPLAFLAEIRKNMIKLFVRK